MARAADLMRVVVVVVVFAAVVRGDDYDASTFEAIEGTESDEGFGTAVARAAGAVFVARGAVGSRPAPPAG